MTPDSLAARNREIVQGVYVAFARRDIPVIPAPLSPDVVWAEPADPLNPSAGTRHGHQGFLEQARIGMEAEEILLPEPRRSIPEGDSVAVAVSSGSRDNANRVSIPRPAMPRRPVKWCRPAPADGPRW